MIKVRLLNNGGWIGLDCVTFPVEVYAHVEDFVAHVPSSELDRVGAESSLTDEIGSFEWSVEDGECELVTDTPAPSNPQTTDLAIHCNGIDEVSYSNTAGFKQMVTLKDACVEGVIENIGADRFFVAFDNEELAEHLRKYGYEVSKND